MRSVGKPDHQHFTRVLYRKVMFLLIIALFALLCTSSALYSAKDAVVDVGKGNFKEEVGF